MTPRKPIIYGPDGQPLITVRDRVAPLPRQHAGLEGWVSWTLVNRDGRTVKGGEQHNLILNGFLDFIATTTASQGAFGAGSLNDALTHFAVGTGSTEPNVTDTALDAELARTTTLIVDSRSRPQDGVYDIVLEREFDFAEANGNLTEFGFANGAGGNMLVRELFRDGAGNPTTVVKTSSTKLRIAYTLTVTLAPVTPTAASFAITGVGTINGAHQFYGAPGTANADLHIFSLVARGKLNLNSDGANVFIGKQDNLLANYTSVPAVSTGWASQTTATTPSTYTPGSYSRAIAEAAFDTSLANGSVQTLGVGKPGSSGSRYPGWAFSFDESDRFVKDNLHNLTISDFITVTWGRA